MQSAISYKMLVGSAVELEAAEALLRTQGPNRWLHLSDEEIQRERSAIVTRRGMAIIAVAGAELVGFCVCIRGEFINAVIADYCTVSRFAQIGNVVVHSAFRRRGVARSMVRRVVVHMRERGVEAVFIERHEQNLPMQRVLETLEFEDLATYLDVERRSSGSRSTTISRLALA